MYQEPVGKLTGRRYRSVYPGELYPRLELEWHVSYRDLLGIDTEDDLARILLQNTQYLRLRGSQCMPVGTQFCGGTSMYMALFCKVASRDENTIEAHWATIARFWGPWYRSKDYYYQINQLRSVHNLPAADKLTEAHAGGVYSNVTVLADPEQEGYSEVLLTLRTENTRQLPREAFKFFPLPLFTNNILVPDPGYGIPLIYAYNSLKMGFRFIEEASSLHCYTCNDERPGQTQTLSEVANALVTEVDEKLRPFASTYPINKKKILWYPASGPLLP